MGISGLSSGDYRTIAAGYGDKLSDPQNQIKQLQKQLEQWEDSDTDSEIKPQMIEMLKEKITQVQEKIPSVKQNDSQPQAKPAESKNKGPGGIIDVSI